MTIGFDLGHDLDLQFSRSNMEFAISRPKMVRLPRNKKQTCRLNFKPQMWPSDLTLAVTLTLNFLGQIWNSWYLGQKWSDCYETKSKHVNWTLKSQLWLLDLTWAMTLTLNRQGQIWNLPKMVRLPRNKKQTYRLHLMPQICSSDLTLAMTLNIR